MSGLMVRSRSPQGPRPTNNLALSQRLWSPLIPLTVARRAVCEALDFVLLHELPAECQLVAGRLVKRIKNFRTRTQVILRRLVTIDAPSHVQRLSAPGYVHFGDGTV